MGAITLKKKRDGVTEALNAMMNRANTLQAYFDRVVWVQYQKAQIQRWETENTSETGQWRSLTTRYAASKPKRFAGYPGGGRVLMMATGKLAEAAMGRDTAGYYKLVTNHGIRVGINESAIPYAKYAAVRPYMSFGPDTLSQMREGISQFIRRGELRVSA